MCCLSVVNGHKWNSWTSRIQKLLKATSRQSSGEYFHVKMKESIYAVAVKYDIYARVTAWRYHSIPFQHLLYFLILLFASSTPSEGTTLDNRPSGFGKEDLAMC